MPKGPSIFSQPAPPGRQRTLDRDGIVAAAIALADEQGIAAVTMKAVAARLGPYSPMALYRYVHNKDGLVDLMLDAAVATVPLPGQTGPHWRDDLRAVALATRGMIQAHPWFAWLVHTRPPAGPHAMRRTEFMLRVLVEAGATLAEAMTFAALVDRHVFGSGLQESQEAQFNRDHGLDSAEKQVAAISSLHELAREHGDLPLLTGWLAQPTPGDEDDQFRLGLDFLLDGITGRLPPRSVERH